MRPGSALEVFAVFLKLGVTSFGGPIAHLGYFQREIVGRRGWIDETRYAQLVALCQFLPGPGSSQASFALGMLRAGWSGAFAAFAAFTFPSVLLMLAFAAVLPGLDQPLALAAIHGLKLLAIAVVAQGLTAMAARLAPDLPRRLLAIAAALVLIFAGGTLLQLTVIVGSALLGLLVCRQTEPAPAAAFELGYSHRTGVALLVLFAVLLALAFVPMHAPLASAAAAFYRAGALVFGGGHVVLPLLHDAVVEPGWVSQADFVAGYGAAQAVPGPMFSLAAFLGARMQGIGLMAGALVGVVAIMLPGLLLVAAALPGWHWLARHPRAPRAIAGVNAAVVGLLAAALYDPLWTSAVTGMTDAVIALAGFALLSWTRASVLIVMAWCIAGAVLAAALGL
jgi:chromate transporter